MILMTSLINSNFIFLIFIVFFFSQFSIFVFASNFSSTSTSTSRTSTKYGGRFDRLESDPLLFSPLGNISEGLHHQPKHKMVMCTKVSDEEPYLVEWIEFYRLQGVTKFVLSTESDSIQLLKQFYAQRGYPDLIEVISTRPFLAMDATPYWVHGESIAQMIHRIGQLVTARYCMAHYQSQTEWLIHADVDEFMYPPLPEIRTLWEYLYGLGVFYYEYLGHSIAPYPVTHSDIHPRSEAAISHFKLLWETGGTTLKSQLKKQRVSSLVCPAVMFGLSGKMCDPRTSFHLDPVSGKVQLRFDPSFSTRFSSFSDSFKRLSSDISLRGHKESSIIQVAFQSAMTNPVEVMSKKVMKAGIEALEELDVPELVSQHKNLSISEMSWEFVTEVLMPKCFESNKFMNQKASEYAANLNLASFYPLLIEDQMFHLPLNGQDGYVIDNILELVKSVAPQCRPYIENEQRIDKAIATGQIEPGSPESKNNISSPNRLCNAKMYSPNYPDLTAMGKALYWTGETTRMKLLKREGDRLRRNKNSVREDEKKENITGSEVDSLLKMDKLNLKVISKTGQYPREVRTADSIERRYLHRGPRMNIDYGYDLFGCEYPWVHTCGHWGSNSSRESSFLVSQLYEMKINHFVYRSLERRTVRYPLWRKNHALPYLFARFDHIVPFEKYMNAVFDPVLFHKFGSFLRPKIMGLHPVAGISSPPELLGSQFYGGDVEDHICSADKLLKGSEVMCPMSHPIVATGLPEKVSPPFPTSFRNMCIKPTTDQHLTILERFSLSDAQGASDRIMCPGYPEVSCCDYNQILDHIKPREKKERFVHLEMNQIPNRHLELDSWRQAGVCGGCGYE